MDNVSAEQIVKEMYVLAMDDVATRFSTELSESNNPCKECKDASDVIYVVEMFRNEHARVFKDPDVMFTKRGHFLYHTHVAAYMRQNARVMIDLVTRFECVQAGKDVLKYMEEKMKHELLSAAMPAIKKAALRVLGRSEPLHDNDETYEYFVGGIADLVVDGVIREANNYIK